MENRLANTIRVGLILILVTPLIVTVPPMPVLFFPYIVGKALYSRLLIELVFAMWLVLAFWYPAYRPHRSRLILIFAIYVKCHRRKIEIEGLSVVMFINLMKNNGHTKTEFLSDNFSYNDLTHLISELNIRMKYVSLQLNTTNSLLQE